MSAPPPAAAQTNPPDPPQDRPPVAQTDTRGTGFLLGLVRKLIDFARQLAAPLQQHPPITSLPCFPRYPGAVDIGPILARILRGLLRAVALEARLLRRADRSGEKPASTRPSSPRRPRAARPAARPAADADPDPARLPTLAEIAAQDRHRPIGAVLVDICRDLDIVPAHPLWRDLQMAIIMNGGSLLTFLKNLFKRSRVAIADRLAAALPALPAASPPAAGFATGPP